MKTDFQSILLWINTEMSEQSICDPDLIDMYWNMTNTANMGRHYIAELLISLDSLSIRDKRLFSNSIVFTIPWIHPSQQLFKRIARKNRVTVSYVEQRFHSINVEISEKMNARGFVYFSPKKKKPAPKMQSLEDFFDLADCDDDGQEKKHKKKDDHPQFDRNGKQIFDLSEIKPKKPIIASLNEDDLFCRISFECERRHVPRELIPRLMIVTMVYLKTDFFKPLLLVGSAGIGKTYFGKILSDVLELPLHMIAAPSAATSRGLSGDSRTYNSSNPGEIVQAIYRYKVANPIILIDEIDKASSRRDAVHNISDELLSCLDGSRTIYDNYQQTFVSTAGISFILTANEIHNVPLWLRDRCEVINFPDPDPIRLLAIVSEYVKEKMNLEIYNHRIYFSSNMVESLVNRMYAEGQISIRQYLSAVDKLFDDAYFRMLLGHLPNVLIAEKSISEVLKSRAANGKRHYGFSL